jgi:hypothetical protein
VSTLKSTLFLHASCTNHAAFRAVVTVLSTSQRARAIHPTYHSQESGERDATAAINVQPNRNLRLSQCRRAHRLLDRVDEPN